MLWRTAEGLSNVPVQKKNLVFIFIQLTDVTRTFTVTPLASHVNLASQSDAELDILIDNLNMTKPGCPVRLNRLIFAKGDKPLNCVHDGLSECICAPYVYLKCGHVQGNHKWKLDSAKVDNYTCPVCICKGPIAKLEIGMETTYMVDRGPLTHCFDPCGCVASENTTR